MSVACPSDPPPSLVDPGAVRGGSEERSAPATTTVEHSVRARLSQPPDMTEVRPPRKPRNWLGAVPYAISVLRHRRRARAMLGYVQHESEEAERQRDLRMAHLARMEEAACQSVPALVLQYERAMELQRVVDELETELVRAGRVGGEGSSEVLSLRARLAFARRDVEVALCDIARSAMALGLPGFAEQRGAIAAVDLEVAALRRRLQAVSVELAELDPRWVRRGLAVGSALVVATLMLLVWLVGRG